MSDLRDPGDAWFSAADGNSYWGRFGAAGLLAYDRERDAILLQHRVTWSDHGDTWGIPGGARHEGEAAIAGAIREAQEEAGVPDGAVTPRFTHVLDRGDWTYATLVAEVVTPFKPTITDPESHALEWAPVAEVEKRDLHPAFAESWTHLQHLVARRPTVIVDAANVVGAVPDGWWKDRRGANERLRDRLEVLAQDPTGVRAGLMRLSRGEDSKLDRMFPAWILVTEGAARGIPSSPHVRVVGAEELGDDAIVDTARTALDRDDLTLVVTSDAELRTRVEALGATTRGAKNLVRILQTA